MSVTLQKGQKVSLAKEGNGLSKILIGLGWDAAETTKKGFLGFLRSSMENIDCDAFVLLLQNDRLVSDKDIVYFGNLMHHTNAVEHMGDNLTGEGDGDDEQIQIDLDKLPSRYNKVVVAVNIYEAQRRNQHFGMIKNAFVRIVDEKKHEEMCIYKLDKSYSGMTTMLFGELYRGDGEWKFKAIGEGTKDASIGAFAQRLYT